MALNTLNLFSHSPAFVTPKSATCSSEQTTLISVIQLELCLFGVCFFFFFLSSSHCEGDMWINMSPSRRRKRLLLTSVYLTEAAPEGGCLSLWGGSPKENESSCLLTRPASLVKIFPVVSLWCSNKSVRNLILLSSCSVAQLCPTLCEPMDCSTPGFSVLHHLLELATTHVHLFSQVWPKLMPF